MYIFIKEEYIPMKKLVSMILTLGLVAALSVTAFAAPSGYTKDQLMAQIDANAAKVGAVSDQIKEAKAIVSAMTEDAAKSVDLQAVANVIKPANQKLKDGTLATSDLSAIETQLNAVLPAGVTVKVASMQISGTEVKGSAVVSIDSAASETGSAIDMGIKLAPISGGTSTPEATVIKKTGADLDMTGVSILAFAVIAVLGAGVVVTRKLGLAN